MSEESEKSLKDEIKDLNNNFKSLLQSDKVKKVKSKKLSRADKKKGYIRYLFLDENKNLQAVKVPISEGTTFYKDAPRIATPDYMFTWDGDPCIFQPGWSCKPWVPQESIDKTTEEKMNALGYQLLANRVELGAIKGKKSMPGWIIFAVIIGLIVVGYLLLS